MGNFRKAKVGLFLIGSRRFRTMGQGTQRGTYNSRKEQEVNKWLEILSVTMECVYPGIIYEGEDGNKAYKTFLASEVDCVVVSFLSWAEDFSLVRLLRDIGNLPLLFVHVVPDKVDISIEGDDDNFVEFLSNGALVGAMEGSGSLARIQKEHVVIVGELSKVCKEVNDFAQASRVRSLLRTSTFGLLPYFNEVMWSTYMDPYRFFTHAGPELRFISYTVLQSKIQNISDSMADIYVGELTSRFQSIGKIDRTLFRESARASLALLEVCKEYGLDALVLNDVDHELFRCVGLRPGFYPDEFNQRQSVLVPEADLGSGLAVMILKLLSKHQVNFMEPFYIEREQDTFVGGHAGPNDYNAQGQEEFVKISIDTRFAKTNFRYAGAPVSWLVFNPGIKTSLNICEKNGRIQMIATIIEALPCKHFISGYSHGRFKAVNGSSEALFTSFLNIGGTQHFVMTDGDFRPQLEKLAKIMDFDYYEI